MTTELEEKPANVFDHPSLQPLDEHNRKWASYVHPTDWKNPEPDGRYNLLVIGAGPAGLVAAIGAAGLGAKVALIEKNLMGGDCLNVGCVPSKGLISAARAAASVRDANEFGVDVPAGVSVEFGKVMERLRRLRADISHHDSAERFRDLGVDVFIGAGQFTGLQKFEIDGKTINFSKACIATGARAAELPIPGLADVGALTNETVFSLTELPKKLAVIGAGPIGCELSQSFARLGSEVYLIEAMHGILPREDPEASAIVKESLMRDGVNVLCCGKNLEISQAPDGKRLSVNSHDTQYEIVVDEIIAGVGRAPNVENLGLEAAGVEYDKTGIKVDDKLRTTNKRIFAAGDVASKYKFTHSADFMARIVIRNALFFGRAKASALTIPWATYTEPEIAHVGEYEKELNERGADFQTFVVKMNEVDRAILDGEDNGLVKVHASKKGKILGATIVSSHAGDLISEISLAMTNGLSLGSIANTIHPYPTQADAIRKVGDEYNRTRISPFVKKLFDKVLRWQR